MTAADEILGAAEKGRRVEDVKEKPRGKNQKDKKRRWKGKRKKERERKRQ